MKILVPVRAVVAGLRLVNRKEREQGARLGLRQWVHGGRVLLLLGVVAVVGGVLGRRGPGELVARPEGRDLLLLGVVAVVLGRRGPWELGRSLGGLEQWCRKKSLSSYWESLRGWCGEKYSPPSWRSLSNSLGCLEEAVSWVWDNGGLVKRGGSVGA